jgi:hypothetical protein
VTASGTYELRAGHPSAPGRMPAWLAQEVIRVATPRPHRTAPLPQPRTGAPAASGGAPARYLDTVITRGAAELANLDDGRQCALSVLAYKAGGLLAWSGLPHDQVLTQLVGAGTASGLTHALAHRIARRALANGIASPLPVPTPQSVASQAP